MSRGNGRNFTSANATPCAAASVSKRHFGLSLPSAFPSFLSLVMLNTKEDETHIKKTFSRCGPGFRRDSRYSPRDRLATLKESFFKRTERNHSVPFSPKTRASPRNRQPQCAPPTATTPLPLHAGPLRNSASAHLAPLPIPLAMQAHQRHISPCTFTRN